MRSRLPVALVAAAALVACTPAADTAEAPPSSAPAAPAASAPAAAPAGGYTAPASLEGGYYLGDGEPLDFGRYRFLGVAVRGARAAGAWDAGDRSGPPPISVEFIDEQAPGFAAWTDGPVPEELIVSVQPIRYTVAADRLSFEGSAPNLGAVRFSGVPDAAALLQSQRADDGSRVVMQGALTVAGAERANLRFLREDPDAG